MSNNAWIRRLLTSALLISSTVHAAIPSVPPAILAQLKNMSPTEQRALARQYGFDLNQVLAGGGGFPTGERPRATLGAPGEPLETFEQMRMDELQRNILTEGQPLPLEDQEGEEELKRFGSDLFDAEISTFAPVDNIPVPEGYRLGIGDELNLIIIGKEAGDFPLLIDRDGSVTLPRLGNTTLSGLTFPEAKALVEARVREQLIGSEAILSMGSMRSINVFLAGEVNKPGNYSVSALTTLSQAIFVSGGISDSGSYRNIMLKRNGSTAQSFDVYDLLLFGDNSSDVRLRSGDVVFVPVAGPQISISGEVVRPAIYEFEPGDSIQRTLEMAGGIKARGYAQQAFLNRYQSGEALPRIVNLNLLVPENLSLAALDGDELSVRAISQRASNPIAVDGPTEIDKVIGWSEGLRIADVFKDLEGDLKPVADLNLSLIVRRKNALNDIAVLPFSLSRAVVNPSAADNIELKPFDRIVILPLPGSDGDEFKRFEAADANLDLQTDQSSLRALDRDAQDSRADEAEPELNPRRKLIEPIVQKLKQQARSGERAQVVSVSGAVQLPGEYPLLGDGAIDDVIALAGGYNDGAYLKRAEIRRIALAEDQTAVIEFLNLDLTSSSSNSFKLEGRDTLRVNRIPNWSTDDTVELTGEFLFPGVYTISQGETVANLVERAGGFTNDAFLSGAQFFSATARTTQSQQLKKIAESVERRLASRKAAGEFEGVDRDTSTDGSLNETISEELLGRVVVDLQAIINGNESANVIVEAGDSIFVPKFSNTIAVVGEVYEPGTFKFEDGMTIDDYVETAGGHTTFALGKNTYLLKANGTVRFSNKSFFDNLSRFDGNALSSVEPGDVIVVPTNLDYDPPLARITAVTNVVFQSLTSIAAFLSITKN